MVPDQISRNQTKGSKSIRKEGFSGLGIQLRSIDCTKGFVHNLAHLMKSNVFATSVVILWLFLGMVVYKTNNVGFRWADAFYFSVQAGFSIGFGSLSETDATSQIYSCFHVIIGGLLAGTLIGSLFETILDKHESFKQSLMVQEKRAALEAEVNADGVVTPQEKCTLMCDDCKNFWETEIGEFTWLSILTFLWLTMGTIVARWTNQDVGDGYMTTAAAMEFAVTAVTTGGLSGFPKELGYSNSLRPATAVFCGFYCIIGVPLYGMWIGKWAAVLSAQDTKMVVAKEASEQCSDLDNMIAKAYVRDYMHLIYPSKEEGGIMTAELLQKRKELVCPMDPEVKENPALVDALFIYLIKNGRLDLETLEGFRKGWAETVGARNHVEQEAMMKEHSIMIEEDIGLKLKAMDGNTHRQDLHVQSV